jgi:hypothetical protein
VVPLLVLLLLASVVASVPQAYLLEELRNLLEEPFRRAVSYLPVVPFQKLVAPLHSASLVVAPCRSEPEADRVPEASWLEVRALMALLVAPAPRPPLLAFAPPLLALPELLRPG